MIRKGKKQTRMLPTRGALNDVVKSPRTLLDYSKGVPTLPLEPTSNILRNLQYNPRKDR